ncbi:MAG: preprotein translocase subunit SecA [Sedimentisphaerales bacterium]|nr:preprotein translocase subunit SecA [Sedimentisphaerales bacterium]
MAIMEIIGKTLTKLFSTSSERYVKKHSDFIAEINALESDCARLTDDQLREKTDHFKALIKQKQDQLIGMPLRDHLREIQLLPEEARRPAKKQLSAQLDQCCSDILPEAFAIVRETSDRHLGIRNVFDDQLDFDPGILSSEMRQVFDQVKKEITDGRDVHQITLPPEFYAEIREHYPADKRPPFRFRHFDVQMIGGNVLYQGKIAEMATGEGKTLVATLAAYVVALSGRKVHIITVNDYLAKRDRDWMGPVYEALGLTVGAIQSDMDAAGQERRAQYACDITYGTNNEFGFDYLRDNMKNSREDQVQGPLDYCIVDEVDSILIDEARTPLIISGPAFDDTDRYKQADKIARELIAKQRDYTNLEKQIDHTNRLIANLQGEISTVKKAKDSKRLTKIESQISQNQDQLANLQAKLERATQYYEVEYDRHSVHLTHEGIGAAQELAGLGSFYVGSNMEWPHLMEQALRAHIVFEREKNYVVQDGEVIIVDEFTGRLMHGRQWSDGLHQAVEAKENVQIKRESQTLATITIQNFFKLYQQLAGMTGTAMTEADEFMKIYQLEVVSIPTNKPIIRDDRYDLIFKTYKEKFNAIVDEIFQASKAGRPVLIGTISIEKSEALSEALTKSYGLEHEVLNAKQHAREAMIVAKAGHQHQRRDGSMWGNVTIATNMAGRGTDIKLGSGVVEAGGLHVLGTERHEARRIDNQLRGRCGRQGDDGSSQFYLSFEDDLMQMFGGDRMLKLMSLFRWPEGEPLIHKKLSQFVEKTQKKVEQRNFESRKSLLEYDEVMDYQRQVFYTRRQSILEGIGLDTVLWEMIDDTIAENCTNILDRDYPYICFAKWAQTAMGVDLELDRIRGADAEELENTIRDHAQNNAEQEITITLGEYMSEDVDPRDWDLSGLSKWAMSKFSVNVSQNQLRKMTVDDIQEQLIDAAVERIKKFDCSIIASFLDEDYPRKCLCDWVNQKFNLDITLEQLNQKDQAQIQDNLLERARQVYRRREIEYPVDYILNVAMRRQQTGSSYAAQEITQWANYKYQANLKIDDIQNLSFEKLRQKLLDLSDAYNNGQLAQEIDQQLSNCRWEQQDRQILANWASERFHAAVKPDDLDQENARNLLINKGSQFLRSELTDLEKFVLLNIYDSTWKDHLYTMDHLKGSVGLRGFAERDPKMEYKREGFRLFQEMLSSIRDKVTNIIFKARLEGQQQAGNVWNISATSHAEYERFQAQSQAAQTSQEKVVKTIKLEKPKVGRNEPCPCGSGKKYKKCCGRNVQSSTPS